MTSLPITVTVSEDGGTTLPTMTNTGASSGGLNLRITEWDGWTDTPDIRANPQDIPGGDGSYDDEPLLGPRIINLRGVARAVDGEPSTLITAKRLFEGLLIGENRSGQVSISENGETGRYCKVRLNGSTKFALNTPVHATWSMSLYAADSKRRSVSSSSASTGPSTPGVGMAFPWTFPWTFGAAGSAGRISVTNSGTLPADVRLSIAGACANPSITLVETGQKLAFATSIGSGQILTIDSSTGEVLLNDAAWGYTITSDSEFPENFKLPVGNSTLFFAVDSGSPVLTATWADTTP